MCKTFTGLKLKGETGRFGKTEISDVMGLYGMPDEKVVSGCDWGNILVWEAGLIKYEVTRKSRQKCHDGAITQFELQNGELMTSGKFSRESPCSSPHRQQQYFHVEMVAYSGFGGHSVGIHYFFLR